MAFQIRQIKTDYLTRSEEPLDYSKCLKGNENFRDLLDSFTLKNEIQIQVNNLDVKVFEEGRMIV